MLEWFAVGIELVIAALMLLKPKSAIQALAVAREKRKKRTAQYQMLLEVGQ